MSSRPHSGTYLRPPDSVMSSTPNSGIYSRLPDPVMSSTPNSGTYAAPRTNLYKNRFSQKKLSFKPSAGGLVESFVEVKEEIRFKQERGGGQGDRRGVGGGGGAVRPDQVRSWSQKQFYGEAKKEDINAKINRVTSKMTQESSKYSGGDYNFNSSHTVEEETEEPDLLDTIDLSQASPSTSPPPAMEQRVLPHNIGFKNYGNTCYMNAVTQALLGLNTFVREVIVRQKSQADGDQGLLQAFSQLCLACTKGEVVSANQGMVEMKRQFELVDKQFEGNRMQDASEFLCRALEKMSETESLRIPASPEPVEHTQEMNIIENYFLHQKEETIVCLGCKAETKCKHSDLTMWCDTVSLSSMNRTRSMSLQHLLEQSLAEEGIERRCEECGHDEASTSSRLVKLPRVLVIILKRYRYSEQDQKVHRLVDIPETVSLTSLVSDNASLAPTTPVKTRHDGQGGAGLETPAKFKGLGVTEVGRLSEEDQLEYMMFVSQKEAVDNLMNRSGADEDADLKAALEASLVDDHLNHSDEFLGRTPAKKRSFDLLGGGVFTHVGGDIGHEKLDKAMEYMKSKESNTGTVSVKTAKKSNPTVRKSPRKKVGFEQVPHPMSKEQEEADLQEALELSRQEQESVLKDTPFEWAMEDVENNNMVEMAMPEHRYQLASVVSHHGASARAGHYLAEVFRFDVGRWVRYDDARVSFTDGVGVRTGANTGNGYILTYLHQAQWEEARREGGSIPTMPD